MKVVVTNGTPEQFGNLEPGDVFRTPSGAVSIKIRAVVWYGERNCIAGDDGDLGWLDDEEIVYHFPNAELRLEP